MFSGVKFQTPTHQGRVGTFDIAFEYCSMPDFQHVGHADPQLLRDQAVLNFFSI